MTEISPIKSDALNLGGIRHGFFTRQGGVSDGIYKGLNVGLGSEDRREHVLENRSRVAQASGVLLENLLTVFQVHSSDVKTVAQIWSDNERPKVDAMVTNQPDIAIGILTADCGPVLFADTDAGVIGGAHAGWKGATSGVLENTIVAMEELGAKRSNIKAALGPTISANHYEVGPEFVARLLDMKLDNEKYLVSSERSNHAMFDLPAYIVDRLDTAGVEAQWTGHCTYADEKSFFSYRRKTHRREADYGRQISVISLETN